MLSRKIAFFILLVLVSSLLSGCGSWSKPTNDEGNLDENKTENNSSENKDENKPPKLEVDIIREQVNAMTLNEKIGQMVIVGLEGYTISESSREMIDEYHVGGFVLLGENVSSSNQIITLVNSLKNANSKNKIPLFLSIDEEGGRVSRIPQEFKKFPSNKIIGGINNTTFSFKIGSLIASELKGFGLNMDFAPVLDINSNPNNPIIGDRSFGSNPEIVARLGIQTMKGIQSGSIIPVVKHFPGHGDTSMDSHIGLPTVNNTHDRLKSFEFLPFSEAIKNNADAVMIAHILLPKIDSNNPASMSKIIITDNLRNSLKFNGVIITDDMTMGAITKNYNIGAAAVKSVNAGTDIILVCHLYDNETVVLNALRKAAESGAIPESQINESVYRILKLKQKYNITDNIVNSIDIKSINNEITALLNTYIKK